MTPESQETTSDTPEYTYQDMPEPMRKGLQTLKRDYKIQSTSGTILVWGFSPIQNHDGEIVISPEAEQNTISLNGKTLAINTEFKIQDIEGFPHRIIIEPRSSGIQCYKIDIDSI